MRFKLTIQSKLLLASTALLIIPWIGYQYIQEMQHYLQKNMENDLLAKVKLVAASLHERPALFNNSQGTTPTIAKQINIKQHLYVRPIRSRIKLDGLADDWNNVRSKIYTYDQKDDLLQNVDANLSFNMQLGSKKHSLYVFFQVHDDNLVFRKKNGLRLDRSDHLIVALQNQKGEYVRYIITAKKSGWVNAFRILPDNSNSPEIRIKGSWLKTSNGYNLEISIPTYLIGEKLSFAFADVNNISTRDIKSIIATSKLDTLEQLGTIVVPSPQVEKLLSQIQQKNSRIWVVNNSFHVIALSDQLLDDTPNYSTQSYSTQPNLASSFPNTQTIERSFISGVMHLIYQQFLKQPSSSFVDDLSTASQLNSPEIITALKGQTTIAWRSSPDNRVSILTATHPIYARGKVMGAVAIEETSNNIVLLQNQAMEILINLSILTFTIAFIILIVVAIRLSSRIKKLRDEADKAITSDGKVIGEISYSTSLDEIGDLSRSTSNMLERLGQYNRYLETMASKLAHELRTPITVIRSSIENMEASPAKDRATYLARASTGINRLNNILTRMSEASRLEQTLQTEQLVNFNLASIIQACVDGYQQANTEQAYVTKLDNNIHINGSPDLIAQMLDKLIANANDYSKKDSEILLLLFNKSSKVYLQVLNQGEQLKKTMLHNLFDSMVSMRTQKTKEPHLGLGLHIVRLIAEFHHGTVNAYNKDSQWVCFEVILPIENSSAS